MIFCFTPRVSLWGVAGAAPHEPSTSPDGGVGCSAWTASNLVMALAAFYAGGGKAELAVAVRVWISSSSHDRELYLRRCGLSLCRKLAPAKISR